MEKKTFLSSLLLLALSLLPYELVSQQPSTRDEKEALVIYADSKKISAEAYQAQGHVEVIWEEYHLYADAIDYNFKTKELLAEGRVTMAAKDHVLSGEKLTYNLKTNTGVLYDTYGLISPFVHYESDRLTQTDKDTLSFSRLDFSSCTQIVPRWRISGRKGKIKKDKYIEMRDVWLRIKEFPVFYLPYLRYPIAKDGRATGLLFPHFGNSSLRGFFLLNSIYWDIRPNLDTTFTVDYYSKLGVGLGDEFRYLFPKATGSLRFYYFRYNPSDPTYGEMKSDYYVVANHAQDIGFLNSRLVLSVNQQSRPDFLRLLDNNFDRLLSTNFLSNVYWTSTLGNVNFSVNASRSETYYTFANSSNVIQYLPAISFKLNKQKFGKFPGYLSIAADYQNVSREGVSYEGEPLFTSGFHSQRFSLVPSYQLPLLQLPWLSASVNVLSKNTIYAKSLDPETRKIVNEPLYMKYSSATATIQGPVFYRIFESKETTFKHLIEPQFDIRYVTKVTNRDLLVPVDLFDYPSYSYAGFTLKTRLLAKDRASTGSASEVAVLSLSQRYYFDPAEANFFRKINGAYPAFAELSGELIVRPRENISFNAAMAYNYYTKAFSSVNIGVSIDRKDSVLLGSVHYSIYRNPYMPANFVFNRSMLRGDLKLDIPNFPVKLSAAADYDFTERQFRFGSFAATFDYQCLVFVGEIRVFSYFGRDEVQFRASVSLGNLGMVADFFGGK